MPMPKVPSPSRARKIFKRKYGAISLLRVISAKSVYSLKQLVFDLGRRVESIENAVSRLPTSRSHLSAHSAGFGYGGPGGSWDLDQYYQNDPVGPIEAGLGHWDGFISNDSEWVHQNTIHSEPNKQLRHS
ncbi:hypothetical protein B0H13DRAFT_1895161 [Mycena leptocephala]|nr:hypothetical protein B0H13DRAFT_1895161 [Mycena leptocephala]